MQTELQITKAKAISFAALWLSYFFCVFSRCIFPFFISQIAAQMHIGSWEIGNFFLHMSLGVGTALFSAQFISRYFAHKKICCTALLLLGFVQILLSKTVSWILFKRTVFFLGFCSGLFLPSSVAMLNDTWPKNSFGRLFSFYSFAQASAFLAAPLISKLSLSYRALDYRSLTAFLAVISICLGAWFLFFEKTGNFFNKTFKTSQYKKLLSEPVFWWLLTALCLVTALNIGIYNMIGHFLDLKNIKGGRLSVSLSRILGILLSFFIGFLADKWEVKKIIYYGTMLCSLLTVFFALMPSPFLKMFCFHLQAPLAISLTPLIHAVISSVSPKEYNTSFVSVFSSVAFVLGAGVLPQFLGFFSHFYSYEAGFLLIGAAALAFSFYLKPKKLPSQIFEEN